MMQSRRAPVPPVSVVIPTRNCLPLLPATIASVDAQGLPGIEIIVVDDGSTDGTAAWLDAQRGRPGLVVLAGAGDGPNVSRNRAIAAASAPLIAFLDADDRWLPGKLAPQLGHHLAHPDDVFSFNDYLHVDPAGADHGTSFEYWPAFRRTAGRADADGYRRLERAAAAILAENVVGTSTVVARRDALQNASGFDAALRSAADWDLWLRLARAGPVAFSRRVGTHYLMQRPGSVSANAALRISCMRRILEAHAPFVREIGAEGAAAVRRARANLWDCEAALARAEGRLGRAVIARLRGTLLVPSGRRLRHIAGDLRSTRHPVKLSGEAG